MSDDPKAAEAFQRRLKSYSRNTAAEIDAAIGECLATHKGRALLWWLLEIGRVGTQPFAGIEGKTAFNCGELNVGNQVLARITEVGPDGYLTMMKEKQNERNALSNPDTDPGTSGQPGAFDSIAAEPDSGD